MNYIFGTITRNGENAENLKTVGESHSELSGYISITREYADSTITDRCLVLEHYRTGEDAEGNCYDWYAIDRHYRYVDKYTPDKADIYGKISGAEDGMCEMDESSETRFAAIEDALCEIDAGGNV